MVKAPQIDQPYFPAIDGLRAICVVLVIAEHLKGGPEYFGHLPTWLGVDIFFLISGFIITTLLFREEAQVGRVDIVAFYVRRFFRIVPIYCLILAGYYASALFSKHRWHLMLHYSKYLLTFCAEFIKFLPYDPKNQPPLGSTWTLGIEEKFYLIFPLVFFVFAPPRWRRYVIPALLLLLTPLFLSNTAAFWLYRSYFGLLIGCTLAVVLHGTGAVRWRAALSGIPAIVSLLLTLGAFYLVKVNWHFIFLFDLVGAGLLASLLLLNSWLAAGLSQRFMVWLGRRSYSMYLVHTFALDIVEHFLHVHSFVSALFCVLLGTLLAAGVAAILYRLIEEPSRIYGKRLLQRRLKTASSISPAASHIRAA